MAKIKVTKTASSIARNGKQAKVLKGLGLGRINSSKVLEDTVSIQGMITKVKHLVKVETVK